MELKDENPCLICFDASQAVFNTSNCHHGFCKDCLSKFFQTKIDEGSTQLLCPQCNTEINHNDIIDNLESHIIDRYLRLKLQQEEDKNPNLRHCPTRSCDQYIPLGESECKKCGEKICIKCGQKSHRFQACDTVLDMMFEFDSRRQSISRCPKCHIVIQKESGCNHMTCKRCNHQFCWICRRNYNADHYSKYNYFFGCPNKQFSSDKPWRYRKARIALPFIILIILAPLLFLLGVFALFTHQLLGAYYLFERWDANAIRFMNTVQKLLVLFFVYIMGGIILYPFVVVFEIGFVISFSVYCFYKLLRLAFEQIRLWRQ